MKQKIFFIVILLIILVSGVLFWLSTPSGHFFRWGITIHLTGYRQTGYSKEKTPTSFVEKLEYKNRTISVFIDKTTIQNHEKYIADRKFLFTSLFLPTTSPYPGVITNIVNCAEEFLPKEERNSQGFIYRVSAGERFNYGICSTDLIRYSSVYGIFDCKNKGVIEIRMFAPSQDQQQLEDSLLSFRC